MRSHSRGESSILEFVLFVIIKLIADHSCLALHFGRKQIVITKIKIYSPRFMMITTERGLEARGYNAIVSVF